eukprot:2236404-Pleurochrysis_carterae.AAC.1
MMLSVSLSRPESIAVHHADAAGTSYSMYKLQHVQAATCTSCKKREGMLTCLRQVKRAAARGRMFAKLSTMPSSLLQRHRQMQQRLEAEPLVDSNCE